MQPTIAIVGSVDRQRTYEGRLGDPEVACDAAAAIGHELALRGFRIVVFSSLPEYIEHAVVRGFVDSGRARPRSILIRGRYGADAEFEQLRQHPEYFAWYPEPTNDWEVSFYRSLLSVDGVLLIGGGRSTFIAGLLAISRQIAIAPVAAFGAAAERVWRRLKGEHAYATEEDIATLAQPWQSTSAQAIVSTLLAQCERRASAEVRNRRLEASARRRTTLGLAFAVALLLLALATVPLTYGLPVGGWQNLTVLVAAAVLASVWGAVIRNAYDWGAEWLRAVVLGSAAGTIAFLLFVAAQMSTNPELFTDDGARRLIFFVLAIGFIGGFTSEVVYRKLRDQDVTQTITLRPIGDG
jgi:hypothetical protein